MKNKKGLPLIKILALTVFAISVILSRSCPSNSLFSDTERIQGLFSAATWNSPQDAAEEIAKTISTQPEELFSLLSLDLRQTYDQTTFQETIGNGGIEIKNAEITSDINLIGSDWADFSVKIVLTSGQTQNFLVVLHHENGSWKLFGTKEI